jgi:hypothetical protein
VSKRPRGSRWNCFQRFGIDEVGVRKRDSVCFFMFGDDGFELDSRKGPIIGEGAPVTCYQR